MLDNCIFNLSSHLKSAGTLSVITKIKIPTCLRFLIWGFESYGFGFQGIKTLLVWGLQDLLEFIPENTKKIHYICVCVYMEFLFKN